MNLIEQLEIEEAKLMYKISKTTNDGTYRNLIKNLADITKLKHDEEKIAKENGNLDKWTLMYSDYKTEGDNSDDERLIRIVAIWEQRGDKIRNHRMFEVKREVEYNDTYGCKSETGESKFITEYNFSESAQEPIDVPYYRDGKSN